MAKQGKLKVLVCGPTGMSGRRIVEELLERGHSVTGFSRNPEKWGSHANYKTIRGSQIWDTDALTKAVEGHDVVVSAFAPSHNDGLQTYCGLVEGAWRIKAAVKRAASKPYLIYIGGAGSLIDAQTGKTTLDEPDVLWPRYMFYGPVEHLDFLSRMLGSPPLRAYYYLRDLGRRKGLLSYIVSLFTSFVERQVLAMAKDPNVHTMPHACRANLSYFEHDREFDWTFLSPPWFYREGPKTGEYWTLQDFQPADTEGRWLGICSGDMGIVVADEAERRQFKWCHWSCFGRQPDTAYYYNDYEAVDFDKFRERRVDD